MISIAMATFNGERYLAAQLNSIEQQTLKPSELVITDDQSDDATLQILTDFSRRSPFPVRIHVNEKRLGYRANFLKCASLCQGQIVAFSDQDDIWRADKLERVQSRFDERSDCLLVYHNSFITVDAMPIGTVYPDGHTDCGNRLRPSFVNFSPLGFSMAFSRGLLQFDDLRRLSRDPNDHRVEEAHDQWIYFLASAFNATEYIPECLVNYRQHDRNVYGLLPRNRWIRTMPDMALSARRQFNFLASERRRISILLKMRARIEGPAALQLTAAIENHLALNATLSLRSVVYSARSAGRRASAILKLFKSGAYDGNSDGRSLGIKGAAKDVFLGMPGAPLLRRFIIRRGLSVY